MPSMDVEPVFILSDDPCSLAIKNSPLKNH